MRPLDQCMTPALRCETFPRAGVSEAEIMKLCRSKTRDMFDRHDIIDQADLTRAMARRFWTDQRDDGKGTANTPLESAETR